ncbi:hypothetical protein [Actinomadura hibisca]|uniref:hypothetical protein n=1 Tax=Actinomadura hibisca TaxID=68565 RepID=UPI00082CBE45|nr:hypothetical protein [Actinomadura hibisca]
MRFGVLGDTRMWRADGTDVPLGGPARRAAFARYEDVIGPYARGCIKSGEGVGRLMVPEGRLMNWLMSRSLKVLPYLPWKNMMAKGARKTAEAVTLPA